MLAGRTLLVADDAERDNLAAFAGRVLQLDDAAVIRLRRRKAPGQLTAWAATGFGILAARTVRAEIDGPDVTVAADTVRDGLAAAVRTPSGFSVALGYSMDSAWRGALPPASGFAHVEDLPAPMLLDLARRGAEVAKDNAGPQGPPRSLLDQQVLEVSATLEPGTQDWRDAPIGIPMRAVFALTTMGFVPESSPEGPVEIVRVRATQSWLRLDARYGSVAQRRGGELTVSVSG